jgi:hypothetical protein
MQEYYRNFGKEGPQEAQIVKLEQRCFGCIRGFSGRIFEGYPFV